MTSHRRCRRPLVWLAAVIVAVAVTALVYLWHDPAASPGAGPAGTPSASSPATPSPRAAQRPAPQTLIIPAIGVRARIEKVTVDSNNNMAAPSEPSHVGWYAPGVVPGQPGDAVIDGHLDWHGVPQAVFYDLQRLRRGDRVDVVSRDGARLRFRVTNSSLVAETAHPAGLFAKTGSPRLTLITCGGDWNPSTSRYRERLLVNATYVGTVGTV